MVRNKIGQTVAAAAGAALADQFIINPLANQLGLGVSDDIVKIGAGIALPMFFKGKLVRDIATAELVLGVSGLVKGIGIGGAVSNGGNGGIGTI